jgi:hypothetical protein
LPSNTPAIGLPPDRMTPNSSVTPAMVETMP